MHRQNIYQLLASFFPPTLPSKKEIIIHAQAFRMAYFNFLTLRNFDEFVILLFSLTRGPKFFSLRDQGQFRFFRFPIHHVCMCVCIYT